MTRADRAARRIAVIGAGPAGIAAGRELLRNGFTNLTIFDTLDGPGGTWRLHTYPGLACDIWAHSYSFSFAPNPDWSASFVTQPEILAYLERCAEEFGLTPHLRMNTRIVSAAYDEGGTWDLRSSEGEAFVCDAVINAMGNQHTPLFPNVPGMDDFEGASFHGTRWDHDVDLTGKRVVVVGSAASAVQIVPEVAQVAGHLSVLQRSANWIMPRRNRKYTALERGLFRRFPHLITALRGAQTLLLAQVEYAVTLGHNRMNHFEWMARGHLEKSIEDPDLRAALLPDSRYGCKRGLVSDDFYTALNRDNVDLIADGLARVTPTGLVTADGREIDADVIIYCTGYRILDLDRIAVTGVGGASLAEVMGEEPQAHKGIAIPGFPNYFMAVGPNGLVLNVSYFVTAERNVATIVKLLAELADSGATAMAPKLEVCAAYNDLLADKYATFSWGAPDCSSYYTSASGHAPFLFPGNFKTWRALHEESGLHEYDVT